LRNFPKSTLEPRKNVADLMLCLARDVVLEPGPMSAAKVAESKALWISILQKEYEGETDPDYLNL